jgi:phospholipid-binding lipoprotein MlaA
MMNGSWARIALCVMVALGSSACVTLPPNAPRSPQDPYERWNRGVYKFNDVLDRAITKPAARAYLHVVPHPIRTGISNFFSNLNTTTVMINDALQGKIKAAGVDLARFLLNTTAGVGGLLDPATQVGLARNDEDFGQTLGKWGVHPGPFIELPVLGPSDLRDAPAKVVDAYTNPRQYIDNSYIKYGLWGLDLLVIRSDLLSLDPTLQSVFDPYAFIRDAYLQRRAYLVADGKVKDEEPLVDPDAADTPPLPVPAPTAPQ